MRSPLVNWYLPARLHWLSQLHLESTATEPVRATEPGPPRPDREPGLTVGGRLLDSTAGSPRGVLTLVDSRGAEIDRASAQINGDYRLTARAPGTYLLVASAAQHRPTVLPITLTGHHIQLDITLLPSSAGRLPPPPEPARQH